MNSGYLSICSFFRQIFFLFQSVYYRFSLFLTDATAVLKLAIVYYVQYYIILICTTFLLFLFYRGEFLNSTVAFQNVFFSSSGVYSFLFQPKSPIHNLQRN